MCIEVLFNGTVSRRGELPACDLINECCFGQVINEQQVLAAQVPGVDSAETEVHEQKKECGDQHSFLFVHEPDGQCSDGCVQECHLCEADIYGSDGGKWKLIKIFYLCVHHFDQP